MTEKHTFVFTDYTYLSYDERGDTMVPGSFAIEKQTEVEYQPKRKRRKRRAEQAAGGAA